MSQLIKIGLLANALVLLSACALPLHHTNTASQQFINQQYETQAFTQLDVKGDIELILDNQIPAYTLVVEGSNNDLKSLRANVKQQTLHLQWASANWNQHNSIKLRMNAPQLAVINLSGSAKLIAQHLTVSNLQIHATDNAQTVLAGSTGFLNAVLSNHAHMDARRLQVQKALINTTDNARADVKVSHNLNAFATGNSNIYYYQVPALLSQYMRQSGSILNMVGIDTSGF